MANRHAELDLPVLSTLTCPSLSGKSKLMYQLSMVGADLLLRVSANSGGGFFSKEWLPLAKILERIPAKEPFTSRVFVPLFRGRSANTPGFLLAVLQSEGVVQRSTVNRRCWARGDLEGFNTKVATLVQDPVPSKAKTRAGKAAVAGSKALAGSRAVSNAVPAAKAPLARRRKQ